MLHMLQWLYIYVANVCPQCFTYFFTRMLQPCLPGCCICFTHMLQMFYLDVAYVCNSFLSVFASVSDTCLSVFICFQTYIANVASGCSKSRLDVARGMRVGSGRAPEQPLHGHAKSRRGRGRAGTTAECRRARETNPAGPRYRSTDRYPIERPGASSSVG
jgi:hypothetical protein